MRAGAVLALAFLAAAAGCGGTKTTVTVTTNATVKAGVGAPADQVLFGHIASLRLDGRTYVMRFDPALLVTGVTANVVQAEEQGVRCKPSACPPVPNDSLVVDDGHQLLTYLVPPSARVTVLTKGPTGTRITVPKLAAIVGAGGKGLWEGLDTGFWIRVRVDTVRSIDQQYHP